jgi:hypothetical protein
VQNGEIETPLSQLLAELARLNVLGSSRPSNGELGIANAIFISLDQQHMQPDVQYENKEQSGLSTHGLCHRNPCH